MEATLTQYKEFYKTAESEEDRLAWRTEIALLMGKLYVGDELKKAQEAAIAEE